jgi:excinuclease ABC subunit A
MTLPEGTQVHGAGAGGARAQGRVRKLFEELREQGFTRVKVDGELRRLEEEIVLDKKYKHDIAVVIDRLVMRPDLRKRLPDSIETAVARAEGLVDVEHADTGEVVTYSDRFMCLHCGTSMPELEPRMFSFNSPHGACPRCTGLGSQMEIDPELIVPDPSLTLNDGAILPWSTSASNYYEQMTSAIADKWEVDMDTPWEDLPRTSGTASCTAPNGDGSTSRTATATAAALVHDDLRGHRPEPRAPLPRDRLGLVAREDRGVHDAAAVPGVQGRAAAARVAGRARRRARHPRVHADVGARAIEWLEQLELSETERADRAADPARDRRAAALPRQRRRRLPVARARGGHAVRRRGAADPAGHADRLVAGRRALHPRRALDRPAPARQRRPDRTLERLRDLGNT